VWIGADLNFVPVEEVVLFAAAAVGARQAAHEQHRDAGRDDYRQHTTVTRKPVPHNSIPAKRAGIAAGFK
jgi:hypothetical protein